MTAPTTSTLTELVVAVREAVRIPAGWPETAGRVAVTIGAHLPSGDDVLAALPPAALAGSEIRSHPLHVEGNGAFSLVALVLRPGQETVIHDHVTWCAVGMVRGHEREDRFTFDPATGRLWPAGSTFSVRGEVCGFAPPGDIHRVVNVGTELSISINAYGTDVSRIGSSVRRCYDRLPA